MQNGDIIFDKNVNKTNYFSMIICILTILILIFQVTADRYISKASHDFIEGEKAKRIAAVEKQRKLLKEQELAASRLAKQQEEEEHLAAMEAKMKEANIPSVEARRASGMDYRDKLGIFNKAEAEAKVAVKSKKSGKARPQGKKNIK